MQAPGETPAFANEKRAIEDPDFNKAKIRFEGFLQCLQLSPEVIDVKSVDRTLRYYCGKINPKNISRMKLCHSKVCQCDLHGLKLIAFSIAIV